MRKKIFSLILSALILSSVCATAAAPETDGAKKYLTYGDLNGDTKVNTTDAVLALRKVAGWDISLDLNAADTDGSAAVNTADAILILRSVAGYDLVLGTPNLSKVSVSGEDSSLTLTFGDNVEKLISDSDTKNGVYSWMMTLAKNEAEFCQFYVAADEEAKGLSFSLSPFTDASGNVLESELLREEYFRIMDGSKTLKYTPDALPPVESSVDIEKGKQQGFFIRVTSAQGQKAGIYRSVLEIKNAEGAVVKKANVYAKVWDFSLPEETSCKTAFGVGAYSILVKHKVTDDAGAVEYYTKYYDYFLKNRINPWCLPVKPTDDRADEYMSNPRVNTFLVAGGYAGDRYSEGSGGNWNEEVGQYLTDAYAKISANPEWAKKAMFYANDEPMNSEHISAFTKSHSFINTYFPGARILIPEHVDNFVGDRDMMSYVMEKSTILCPHEWLYLDPDSGFFDLHNLTAQKEYTYSKKSIEMYGPLKERMAQARADGKETWWYTSDNPKSPMCNLQYMNTGMENRMLFWQQYAYGSQGMLFWATTEWDGLSKGHRMQSKVGLLVYPGLEYGIDGPVSCMRTEIARDGIEDFEYLSLIEKYLGKDKADSYASRMVTDVENYNTDPNELFKIRAEIAAELEKIAE